MYKMLFHEPQNEIVTSLMVQSVIYPQYIHLHPLQHSYSKIPIESMIYRISIPSTAKVTIKIFPSLTVFLFLFVSLSQPITAMRKIYPISSSSSSSSKRNFSSSEDDSHVPLKRLRRLPHTFSKVLELPFRSDADVAIEDIDDCLRFIAALAGNEDGDDVRVDVVEVYPGVTKVVVRKGEEEDDDADLFVGAVEVDTWRFRLPGSARVELARAVVLDRELVVTVPKNGFVEAEGFGGIGRLVLLP